MGNIKVEDKIKRHYLEGVEAFKRNDKKYLYFETYDFQNKYDLIHSFCCSCRVRADFKKTNKEFLKKALLEIIKVQEESLKRIFEEWKLRDPISEEIDYVKSTTEYINNLSKFYNEDISKYSSEYFYNFYLVFSDLFYKLQSCDNFYNDDLYSDFLIDGRFINHFEKNLFNKNKEKCEKVKIAIQNYNEDFYAECNSFQEFLEILKELFDERVLNDKEIIQALKETFTQCNYYPFITSMNMNHHLTCEIENKEKKYNTFIEFDLTKSEDELIEHIRKVKRNFDEDEKKLGINPFILLDKELKHEIIDYDKLDLELIKVDQKKGLGGKLSDILFIYDCRKIGLSEEYIRDSINNYWIEDKKKFLDKISPVTYKKYLNFIKRMIDEEQYKNYTLGVNN